MRDDEFWLRARSPAPPPGTMAALVRARRALAELAGLSSLDYRPMVERAAREVEGLAPYVAAIPVGLIIERLARMEVYLRESCRNWEDDPQGSVIVQIRALSELQDDLRGSGPEGRQAETIAEAAGRTP